MRLFDALRSKPAGNNRGAEGVKPKGTQDGRAVETATPAKRRGLSSIVHFFRTRLAEKSSTTNGPRATPETRHSAKLVDSILKSAAAPFNKMEAHSSVVLRPTMTTENFDAVRANAIDFVEALLPMGQHGGLGCQGAPGSIGGRKAGCVTQVHGNAPGGSLLRWTGRSVLRQLK